MQEVIESYVVDGQFMGAVPVAQDGLIILIKDLVTQHRMENFPMLPPQHFL
ncbi:hypothetical protein TUM19329_36960 (plasmid) [Legionella antarctica]|uniref:Uncharacterized protein n=1 Tax=Legionella antarctica TaxID=2708020 RepID=A0A6F8T9J0_9GAMM|nr:hypothetical protein [Legionella antarctica]BCA97335.1 hypothetical protein TUM19329_36960 [Legionella antarctica]